MHRTGLIGSNAIHSAIVDASALIAAADEDESQHARCESVLRRADLSLVIPALVVSEASYLIGTRLGPRAEAAFLRGLRDFEVEAPQPDEWERIAELVERYANFPLGGTDASVIVLAERLNTDIVITLDRRHFASIRPRHTTAFQLLPD